MTDHRTQAHHSNCSGQQLFPCPFPVNIIENTNDLRGYADNDGVGWNTLSDYRSSPHHYIVTQRHTRHDHCTATDPHVIADYNGSDLDFISGSHRMKITVTDRYAVADLRKLSDVNLLNSRDVNTLINERIVSDREGRTFCYGNLGSMLHSPKNHRPPQNKSTTYREYRRTPNKSRLTDGRNATHTEQKASLQDTQNIQRHKKTIAHADALRYDSADLSSPTRELSL